MKFRKKLLSAIVLSLVMVFGMMPMSAFAEGSSAVAKIGDVEYTSLNDAFKAAETGETVTLLADVDRLAFPSGTASGITVTSAEGVTVGGIHFQTNQVTGMVPENLTLDDITFVGGGNYQNGVTSNYEDVKGLTIKNCNFTNGTYISLPNNTITNLVVEKCEFTGTISASNQNVIYLHKVDGLIVSGCTFNSGGYNGIQANTSVAGDVSITDNTFNATGSRNIYLKGITDTYEGNLTVSGNTFVTPTVEKEDGNFIKLGTTIDKELGVNYGTEEAGKAENYYYAGCVNHTHSYGAWAFDADNHWHECDCGQQADMAAHTPKIINAKEATTSEKGYTGDTICEICGYEIAKGADIPVKAATTEPVDNEPATQTGDNSHIALWMSLLLVSAMGLIGAVVIGKRRKFSR